MKRDENVDCLTIVKVSNFDLAQEKQDCLKQKEVKQNLK